MSKEIEFGQCVWEDYPIKIVFDYELDDYDNYSCHHIKDGKIKAVIVGTNEGGYNTTGVCWECIKERLEKERLEKELFNKKI